MKTATGWAVICALALLTAAEMRAEEVGRNSGLPLPRYVSLKAAEANVRRGPSRRHGIDWKFVQRGMPLRVTAEYDVWRRVEDHEGEGGWVHTTLLSGRRSVLVTSDAATLRNDSDINAQAVAEAKRGVIARLEECIPDWCLVRVEDHAGWVPQTTIWGVGPRDIARQ
ncbi:MAG: SH3 domain-containing protein [Pseudomonadota bacterium]